jgi:hypothetical protein
MSSFSRARLVRSSWIFFLILAGVVGCGADFAGEDNLEDCDAQEEIPIWLIVRLCHLVACTDG